MNVIMEDGGVDRKLMCPLSKEELEHDRDVKIAICSVAILGLATATGIARPFKRFSRVSEIPNRFITRRTRLNGKVERIESCGPLLMVQHRPVIPILPLKPASLPVKISGVSVNSNGVCWLQTVVAGNNIQFIPLFKQKDCVQCEVTIDQETDTNKIKSMNLAAKLIQIGFGKIEEKGKLMRNKTLHSNYIKLLKSAEIIAEKRRLGKWYYPVKVQKVSVKLFSYIFSLIKSKTSKSKKLVVSEKCKERVIK